MTDTFNPAQMNIFDMLLSDAKLGYDDNLANHKGRVIPFTELQHYVGRKVIEECYTQGYPDGIRAWQKLILITSYHKDFDQTYDWNEAEWKYVPGFKTDRIGYSDDTRKQKENCWLSETFCADGRFPQEGQFASYATRFFEYV